MTTSFIKYLKEAIKNISDTNWMYIDLLLQIKTSFNESVSKSVEAPLDANCLPHVLAIYARPRKVNSFEHPASLVKGMKMKNKMKDKMKDKMMIKGFMDKIKCSVDKKAIGDYTLDDQLLAAVRLDDGM